MKISVITATFNSASTIADTLTSVLTQVLPDGCEVEHIVVDGGSTDETMTIVAGMQSRYLAKFGEGGLRWISEPDNGIYDAMNKGIRMATGDVVGLLNSDDFYTSPDVLATVAREIGGGDVVAANPEGRFSGRYGEGAVDAVYGDVHYVDADNLAQCVRYYSSKGFRRWKMRCGYMPAHPSFYCRRAVYSRFGLFDTEFRIAADFEQLLRLIYVNGISTRYVAKDFVTMRTGGASSSGMQSHRRIVREHIRAYRKNGIPSGWLHEAVRYASKGTAMVWHKMLPVRRQKDKI